MISGGVKIACGYGTSHKSKNTIHTLLLFSAIIILTILLNGLANAYTPPMGIPAPSFGIDDVAPAQPGGWPGSEVAGYYYVDNTHTGATDTANTYGYPDKPRLTIPETTYSAGSYVEVHGGPYRITGGDKEIDIAFNCTIIDPCWFRGITGTPPVIRSNTIVSGNYVILENLYFQYSDVIGREGTISLIMGTPKNGTLQYAAIRDSEFAGDGVNHGNSAGITMGGVDSINKTTNIVVYNNTIHDLGDNAASVENDYHGILPADYTEKTWVLENTVYNNGGDAIQVGSNNYDGVQRPAFIYVGNNTFHGDLENAVDIKQATDVIVSNNKMYDYHIAPASDGAVVVSHRQNEVGQLDGPEWVWIIFNEIHTAARGIRIQETINAWSIGNIIYNIHCEDCTSGTTSPWRDGAAIHYRSLTSSGGMIGNTIYDSDIGIQSPSAPPGGWSIEGNIISHRSDTSTYDVRMDTIDAKASTFDYNLMYYPSGNAKIYWGSTVYNVESFKSIGKCSNCPKESAPLFFAPGSNFALQSTSLAKDAGIEHSAYAAFQSRYGIDIRKDITGVSRPQGAGWDLGAYEESPSEVPDTGTALNLLIN